MKHAFILDENIIPMAYLGKNERGEEDLSAATLVTNIIWNCHKIIVNNFLLRKYSQKTDEVKKVHKGAKVLNIINVIHQAMKRRNKVVIDSDMLDIDFPPKSFHDGDIPVVTLAARNKGILVTTDNNLIEKLGKTSITSKFTMKTKRPEDAIQYASGS